MSRACLVTKYSLDAIVQNPSFVGQIVQQVTKRFCQAWFGQTDKHIRPSKIRRLEQGVIAHGI